MKAILLTCALLALTVLQVSAEIIGVETFDYPDGTIATKNGGTFWDYKNSAPAGHGGTPSAWENVSAAPAVVAGRLVTSNSSARRKYHPTEADGTVSGTAVEKIVYHLVTFTTGATLPDFAGLSSYYFGAEQVFFGKPFAGANFAFVKGADTVSTSIAVQANTTYTMLTKLDYTTNTIRLFINPDPTAPEPVTADASFTFGAAFNPSTAVRLASGFSGSAVTWDDLSVATSWSDFTTVVTTPADEDDGSPNPSLGSGTSLREAVKYSPAGITFDSGLSGQTITLGGTELLVTKSLTIDASSLPGSVAVSGNHASRVIRIASGASLTLRNLSIINGNTGEGGGGILNSGTCIVQSCTFSGNRAGGNGGAIVLGYGSTMSGCTFTDNSAEVGGACYAGSGDNLVTHCTFNGNRAQQGGAIYVYTVSLTLAHCTLAGNHATQNGGGIYNAGEFDMRSCIVAGNTAAGSGPDIDKTHRPINLEGVNLLSSLEGTNFIVSANLLIGQPLLSPLGYFGGPTMTMHPLIGSPAIDAAGGTNPGGTDQRGFPRFVDGDASNTAQLDIGAVEVWPRARSLFFTDHPVTTATDEDDGSILPGFGTGTSLREVVKYAPNSTPGGFIITFSAGMAGQTITLGGTELLLNHNVFIDASNLSSPVTIFGNHASRAFNIAAGASAAMHNLNITGGRATDGADNPAGSAAAGSDGGGIVNAGNLNLFSCSITGNRAGDGGDAVGSSGFINGGSGGRGGGVFSGGPLSIVSCDITDNLSGKGGDSSGSVFSISGPGGHGGGVCGEGPLDIVSCHIADNATGRRGNAFFVGEGGSGGGIFSAVSLKLTGSIVAGNITGRGAPSGERSGPGGGISASGVVVISHTTLSGNVSGISGISDGGGGFHLRDASSASIRSSTIAGNQSENGGGIFARGSLFLENVTVAGNLADAVGGISSASTITLRNSIVAGNTSGTIADISCGAVTYQNVNFVGSTAGISGSSGPDPLTGDPLLGPLSDYGGPTFTMLPAPSSPVINAAVGSTVTTDQRGLPMNGAPDLGAVEYQAELSGFTDADSDGMDDRLEPRYGFVVGVQDGALDADHDGQTNAQELGNRTGPRDPTSLLKITSITRTGSDVTFTYTTFPGLSYTIETGPDLTFGGSSFTPVSPPTGFTRTNGLTISTSEPRYFFRIRRN